MKLFIANIPHQLTEAELKQLLVSYGQVESVKLVTDPETGKRKGFGFIQMPVQEQAQKAINGLNSLEIHGRKIVVSAAVDKDQPIDHAKRQRTVNGRENHPAHKEIDGNRW